MIDLGRRVYGLGAVGLGIVTAAYGRFSPDWWPVPASAPPVLAQVVGALLVLGGLVTAGPRIAATIGSLGLTLLFAVGMLALELAPALGPHAEWGGWQAVAESTAMSLGGGLAWSGLAQLSPSRTVWVLRTLRWGFGACLLVFGVSHFAYAKFTASMVPAWLPPSQLIWAYITGAAQIAAGLAVLSGIQARFAAILLTVMYVAFGLLVHVPAVLADPSAQAHWTENAINLVLTGAAWTLAEAIGKAKLGAARPQAKRQASAAA